MKSLISIVFCLIVAAVFFYQAQKHWKIVASYSSSQCCIMKLAIDHGPRLYAKGGFYNWLYTYWTVISDYTMNYTSTEFTIYEAEAQHGEYNPRVINERHQKYKVRKAEKMH